MSNNKRSNLVERESYEYLKWPLDEFVVPLLKEKIDFVLNEFVSDPVSGARVLDIGCGGQPYRKRLEKMAYCYAGLDIINNPEGNVDFIAEIDKELPIDLLNAPKFDLLFCTEVMEHVADWNSAFKNFNLLLAPGGKVIITCPFFFMLHEEPFDFWRPTSYALEHFADSADFDLIYRENAGSPWDVLGTFLLTVSPYVKQGGENTWRKIFNKLNCKLVRIFQLFILWVLKQRKIQQRIGLSGSLYLSNIVVLKKRG